MKTTPITPTQMTLTTKTGTNKPPDNLGKCLLLGNLIVTALTENKTGSAFNSALLVSYIMEFFPGKNIYEKKKKFDESRGIRQILIKHVQQVIGLYFLDNDIRSGREASDIHKLAEYTVAYLSQLEYARSMELCREIFKHAGRQLDAEINSHKKNEKILPITESTRLAASETITPKRKKRKNYNDKYPVIAQNLHFPEPYSREHLDWLPPYIPISRMADYRVLGTDSPFKHYLREIGVINPAKDRFSFIIELTRVNLLNLPYIDAVSFMNSLGLDYSFKKEYGLKFSLKETVPRSVTRRLARLPAAVKLEPEAMSLSFLLAAKNSLANIDYKNDDLVQPQCRDRRGRLMPAPVAEAVKLISGILPEVKESGGAGGGMAMDKAEVLADISRIMLENGDENMAKFVRDDLLSANFSRTGEGICKISGRKTNIVYSVDPAGNKHLRLTGYSGLSRTVPRVELSISESAESGQTTIREGEPAITGMIRNRLEAHFHRLFLQRFPGLDDGRLSALIDLSVFKIIELLAEIHSCDAAGDPGKIAMIVREHLALNHREENKKHRGINEFEVSVSSERSRLNAVLGRPEVAADGWKTHLDKLSDDVCRQFVSDFKNEITKNNSHAARFFLDPKNTFLNYDFLKIFRSGNLLHSFAEKNRELFAASSTEDILEKVHIDLYRFFGQDLAGRVTDKKMDGFVKALYQSANRYGIKSLKKIISALAKDQGKDPIGEKIANFVRISEIEISGFDDYFLTESQKESIEGLIRLYIFLDHLDGKNPEENEKIKEIGRRFKKCYPVRSSYHRQLLDPKLRAYYSVMQSELDRDPKQQVTIDDNDSIMLYLKIGQLAESEEKAILNKMLGQLMDKKFKKLLHVNLFYLNIENNRAVMVDKLKKLGRQISVMKYLGLPVDQSDLGILKARIIEHFPSEKAEPSLLRIITNPPVMDDDNAKKIAESISGYPIYVPKIRRQLEHGDELSSDVARLFTPEIIGKLQSAMKLNNDFRNFILGYKAGLDHGEIREDFLELLGQMLKGEAGRDTLPGLIALVKDSGLINSNQVKPLIIKTVSSLYRTTMSRLNSITVSYHDQLYTEVKDFFKILNILDFFNDVRESAAEEIINGVLESDPTFFDDIEKIGLRYTEMKNSNILQMVEQQIDARRKPELLELADD